MRVKVCGLTRADDVRLACDLGAWALGFVFAPGPRRVDRRRARELCAAAVPGVLKVGVFGACPREDVLLALRDCGLDAVELRGPRAAQDCEGYPVPVFLTLPHHRGMEPAQLKRYRVERFVISAPEGGAADAPALRECWAFAARARGYSVILSGGLDAGNVGEAAAAARPYAVEAGRGVEAEPGLMSKEKLRGFFLAAS